MTTQTDCSCCKARWIEFVTAEEFTQEDEGFWATLNDQPGHCPYHDGEAPELVDASVATEEPDRPFPSLFFVGLWINNTSHIFSAAEGVAGIALYDPNDDEYYVIQLACPTYGT